MSRRSGIGSTIADRLRSEGARVFTTGWKDYDAQMPWGRDDDQLVDLQVDLSRAEAAPVLFDAAQGVLGPINSLVLVHTVDLGGGLLEMSPDLVDRHLAVNVRATLLLMKEFTMRFGGEVGTGRIVLFSSKPPQVGAIAYAASKGAIEWITLSAAAELGSRGVTVNAVNPGPNQTGWMDEEMESQAASRTPLGRVGRPSDAAALVSFLLSSDAAWITGQVISSDGGHFIAGEAVHHPSPP